MATSIADPRRVLVIDDERDVLDTVAAILDAEFSVETCNSPAVAYKLLAREPFDVVCTDYRMPNMTGIDLIESIVDRDIVVSVVLLTGHYELCSADLKAKERLTRALPIGVLQKPYAPQELIDTIRRACSFARLRRAVRGLSGGGER
ncbi:MAG TPA: response regulator [Nannocystaceae bacterium]|nr:response regulator [Nannocystaceae bacterium]